MKPISFSSVDNRKRATQTPGGQRISFATVNKNLSVKNLSLFIEAGCIDNYDTHFMQCISLYKKLLSESTVSHMDQIKLDYTIIANLPKIVNLEMAKNCISDLDINSVDKMRILETVKDLDQCDRVIRNESRLLKRFDLNKIINKNFIHGERHTVFELCSLLDTYSISSKAKMNIALENISYALYKSGKDITIDECVEYIVEYFLTRDPVITDKEFNGYIDVLNENSFINKEANNIAYIFKAREEYGTSYSDIVRELHNQCTDTRIGDFISTTTSILNEKQAEAYIDKAVSAITDESTDKYDATLLLKSIYCLPLLGSIDKGYIDYEMNKYNKLDIKNKLKDVSEAKEIRNMLDNDNKDLLELSMFVSESVHFNNYILDDLYIEETDVIKLLESERSDAEEIQKIIDAFKASNEKSPSKFRNMINRIMVKSPENIINETPNIFAAVRYMLYIAVAASPIPLAPVFAAILALVGKLLTMHLDLKQAEKLLKYLTSEKEKAEKKLDKLSGKQRENQEEYIKTLKKCINKTKDFISNIDDDNEALNTGDDDLDFDLDFNFESAISESSSILEFTYAKKAIDELSYSLDAEILSNIAPLFDNCSTEVSNDFYKLITDTVLNSSDTELIETCHKLILDRGTHRISDESNFMIQCEAELALQEVVKEKEKNKKDKFTLSTLKMAVINFKKKFRDLKGKEQELWRNIDIATVNLTRGIQQALTSDRREAIIKGSIIPSFSKCIKSAIAVGAVGIFAGPVGAAITAVGMLGASKVLNDRERRLLYDEIDTELQVVDKQIQLAENEGNMNQYRFLLNYQKKLTREKHRIKYGIHMSGRTIPEIRKEK